MACICVYDLLITFDTNKHGSCQHVLDTEFSNILEITFVHYCFISFFTCTIFLMFHCEYVVEIPLSTFRIIYIYIYIYIKIVKQVFPYSFKSIVILTIYVFRFTHNSLFIIKSSTYFVRS